MTTGPSLLAELAGGLTALVVLLVGEGGQLGRLRVVLGRARGPASRAVPGGAASRAVPSGPASRAVPSGPASRAAGMVRRTRWRRDREASVPMPLVLDVVASVLEAGAPPAGALATVAACLARAGDPAAEALLRASRSAGADLRTPGVGVGVGVPVRSDPALRGLLEALDLACATGLGPATLVRSAAEQERRRRATAQALAARRLSVFVVLPMALCLLPAFVLLAIVPVVLDLLMSF